MVSKAREDLPLPLIPVMTTSWFLGMRMSMFLRLWTRAPDTSITSSISVQRYKKKPRTSGAGQGINVKELWMQSDGRQLHRLHGIHLDIGDGGILEAICTLEVK